MSNSKLSMKTLLQVLIPILYLAEVTAQEQTKCRGLRCLRNVVRELQKCCNEKDTNITSLTRRVEELEESHRLMRSELDHLISLMAQETTAITGTDDPKEAAGTEGPDDTLTTGAEIVTTTTANVITTSTVPTTTTKPPRIRPQECPDKWTKTGLKCFIVVSSPGVSLLSALVECSDLNTFAFPASILSEDDDKAFITARAAANVSDTSKIWIGLNSLSADYTWYPDNIPFDSSMVDHLDENSQNPQAVHAVYATGPAEAIVWTKVMAFNKLDGYACSIDLAPGDSTDE